MNSLRYRLDVLAKRAHRSHFWDDALRCKGCAMGIDWPGASQPCVGRYKPVEGEVDGLVKRVVKLATLKEIDDAIERAKFKEMFGRYPDRKDMRQYKLGRRIVRLQDQDQQQGTL